MTADIDLPVWPFQPNWRDGITERLSWATVVMTSETGSEQRASSRLSPRRAFEAQFNPVGDERTFFDLFISELGGQEMMIPLWHDRHKLSAEIESGDTRVDCDTEFGEFTDGGLAIMIGADAWSHAVLEIDEVDGTGFTLLTPTDFDWPVGGTVLPMRRAKLTEQPSLDNLTDSVGDTTMRFILNQANDLPDEGEWDGFVYSTYPVVTIPSDFSSPVTIGFDRVLETEDNGIGIAFVRDIADRAFRTKQHVWHVKGKQGNWAFRQFLYRMAGRRSPVWMPTGLSDFAVTSTAAIGASGVDVRRVGLTYVGGIPPGRDRVLARTPSGYQARRITGLGVPPGPAGERLSLDSNLTYAIPAGSSLEFLELMRADGDDIDLLHHADTDGATEVSINFRSFNAARVAPDPSFLAKPTDVISNFGCSEPADDENPCLSYNPWTLLLSYTWTAPNNLSGYAPIYSFPLPQAVTAGMMPNGKTLGQGTAIGIGSFGATSTLIPGTAITIQAIRDNNYPDSTPGGPVLGWRHLTNGSGFLIGVEYYFFFPLDPVNRHVNWDIQFGAGSFMGVGQGDRGGIVSATTGDGTVLTSFTRNPEQLFPFNVSFDY